MKNRWILVAAVLVGLLSFWMTHEFLQAERRRLYEGAEKIRVLAAAQDLPAGTMLEFSDIGTKSVFKSAVGRKVMLPEEVDRILGKKLLLPLERGDPIQWSDVELPEAMRGGLAPTISPGMRALSLPISGHAAVSGLVQPNDRVDILATFTWPSPQDPAQFETVTLTLLQNVTILATGTILAKPAYGEPAPRRSRGYSTVTVEVTLREAELLVFAEHARGQMKLALRNPEDVGIIRDVPEVNFDFLVKELPKLNTERQDTLSRTSRL
jgi:pilus assembly protein CpaB